MFISSDRNYQKVTLGKYQWISQPVRLLSIENLPTDYSLGSKTTFVYNYTYPTLVINSTKTDAEGKTQTTVVKYPFDYATGNDDYSQALSTLKNRHSISVPVETYTYNSNGKVISAILNNFNTIDNSVVLESKMSLRGQMPQQTDFTPSYINNGHFDYSPLYKYDVINYEYTDKLQPKIIGYGDGYGYGPVKAVEYGHGGLYPIATFSNAYTGNDLQSGYRIFYRDYSTSNLSVPVNWNDSDAPQVSYLKWENGKWKKYQYMMQSTVGTVSIPASGASPVRDVVIAPKNATYSTITFAPGIGKTSETDVNGKSIYYEYDQWGRLSKTFDSDKNLLKKYEYSF